MPFLRRKYYDVVAYERSEALKAAAAGGSGKGEALFDARADEEQLRLKKLEERRQQQQERLNTAYNILKHTDMAKDMREQVRDQDEVAEVYAEPAATSV